MPGSHAPFPSRALNAVGGRERVRGLLEVLAQVADHRAGEARATRLAGLVTAECSRVVRGGVGRPVLRDRARGTGGCGEPVIGAAQATALAGGFELLLACDLAVVADDARLGLPEVRRGLFAAGGAMYLARRIPLAKALELSIAPPSLAAAGRPIARSAVIDGQAGDGGAGEER
jgi:1,4-dihydroxy-2-naphthoyl-CoA synthase